MNKYLVKLSFLDSNGQPQKANLIGPINFENISDNTAFLDYLKDNFSLNFDYGFTGGNPEVLYNIQIDDIKLIEGA